MAEVATLILTAKTDGLEQGAKALDQLPGKAKSAEAAAAKLKAAVDQLGAEAKETGVEIMAVQTHLAKLASEGVGRTSPKVQQLQRELARLKAEMMANKTATAVANQELSRLGVSVGTAARSMGIGAGSSRMLAMQLSQVAQQGAVTGDFFRAFTVQAADMALIFGPLGIAIGAAVAVLGPFAADLLRGGEAAKSLADQTDELTEATNAYREAVDAALMPLDTFVERFGSMAVAAKEAATQMGGLQREMALRELAEQAEALATHFGSLEDVTSDDGAFFRVSEAATVLRGEFGLTSEALATLMPALRELENAQGPVAVADAARQVAAELDAAFGSASQMPAPILELRQALEQSINAASDLQGTIEDADQAAGELNQTSSELERILAAASGIDLSGVFSSAQGAANDLLATTSAIIAEIGRISSLNYGMLVNEGGGGPDAVRSQLWQDGPLAGGVAIPRMGGGAAGPARSSGGGRRGGGGGGRRGGGGGGRSAAASEAEKEAEAIRKVVEALEDEIETIGMSEEARRLHQELQKAGVEIYSEEGQKIAQLVEELTELERAQRLAAETMQAIESAAQDFFVGVLSGAKTLEEAIADLLRQLANLFLNQAFQMLWGGRGGGGGLGGLLGGLFGLAGGGPASAGQPYLVNENTPNSEIFVPSQSGAVLNVPQAQQALRSSMGGSMAPKVSVAPAPVIVLDDPRKMRRYLRSSDGAADYQYLRRREGDG